MENAHEARPLAVETFPYKEFLIEVEVYRDRDNGQYHPWPYVRRARQHSDTKKHFLLSPSEFLTKEAAIRAAVEEGQKKIDAGFDIESVT